MNKIYVDSIFKKQEDHEPGPSSYNRHPGFGGDAKESGASRYSMRPRNDPFLFQLKK